jgi:hypothetical protein
MLQQALKRKMSVDIRFYDLNLRTQSSRVKNIGLLPILLSEKSLYGSTRGVPGWVAVTAFLDVALNKKQAMLLPEIEPRLSESRGPFQISAPTGRHTTP